MRLGCLLREPRCVTAQTQALVLLHGAQSHEEEFFQMVYDLPEDFLVFSLRAPWETGVQLSSWFPSTFSTQKQEIDSTKAIEAMRSILTFISRIRQQYQLTQRIHLAGFDQGGLLAFGIALSYPEFFEKVCVLSAYPDLSLLKHISTNKKALRKLDFFVSHGIYDLTIPLKRAREAAPLLFDRKIPFTFREYLSRHTINKKNYLDLIGFLQNSK